MQLIGIDPGHGGADPGATGPTGLMEKAVNLAIAQKLVWYLQRAGLSTFQTRESDQSMELITRTALLNNMKCDYAISVHCNASDSPSPDYIATFIQGTGGEAEKLAEAVQIRLVASTGWPDGGVRVQNLHMNRETNMPSILVECGFISNLEEEEQLALESTQDKIAAAIAQGFCDYLGVQGPNEKGEDTTALIKVIVKGQEVPAVLIGNKTYVELDAFKQANETKIIWDPTDKVVTVK